MVLALKSFFSPQPRRRIRAGAPLFTEPLVVRVVLDGTAMYYGPPPTEPPPLLPPPPPTPPAAPQPPAPPTAPPGMQTPPPQAQPGIPASVQAALEGEIGRVPEFLSIAKGIFDGRIGTAFDSPKIQIAQGIRELDLKHAIESVGGDFGTRIQNLENPVEGFGNWISDLETTAGGWASGLDQPFENLIKLKPQISLGNLTIGNPSADGWAVPSPDLEVFSYSWPTLVEGGGQWATFSSNHGNISFTLYDIRLQVVGEAYEMRSTLIRHSQGGGNDSLELTSTGVSLDPGDRGTAWSHSIRRTDTGGEVDVKFNTQFTESTDTLFYALSATNEQGPASFRFAFSGAANNLKVSGQTVFKLVNPESLAPQTEDLYFEVKVDRVFQTEEADGRISAWFIKNPTESSGRIDATLVTDSFLAKVGADVYLAAGETLYGGSASIVGKMNNNSWVTAGISTSPGLPSELIAPVTSQSIDLTGNPLANANRIWFPQLFIGINAVNPPIGFVGPGRLPRATLSTQSGFIVRPRIFDGVDGGVDLVHQLIIDF